MHPRASPGRARSSWSSRDPDPFGLALADDDPLELRERSQDLQHQRARRFGRAAGKGQILLHEVDGRSLGGDLVDELLQVDQRPGEPVDRRDPDGVTVADVAQAVRPWRSRRLPPLTWSEKVRSTRPMASCCRLRFWSVVETRTYPMV